METASRGWVIDVGAGWRVAAGAHQVVEYLLSPETVRLPLMPVHCPGVLIWREQMIPMVDLAPLLGGDERDAYARRRAVILAYQESPGEPLHYGAVLVRAAPVEVFASDDMACPLPDDASVFRHFVCSCFTHDDKAIPVVDIARLFGRPLPWIAPLREEEGEPAVDVVESTWAAPLGLASTDTPGPVPPSRVWQAHDIGPEPLPAVPVPSESADTIGDETKVEENETTSPVAAEVVAEQTEGVAIPSAADTEDSIDSSPQDIEAPSAFYSQELPDPIPAAQPDETVSIAETAPRPAPREQDRNESGMVASPTVSTQPQTPVRTERVSMTLSESLQRSKALEPGRILNLRGRLWHGFVGALMGAISVLLVLAVLMLMDSLVLVRPEGAPSTAGILPGAEPETAEVVQETGQQASTVRDFALDEVEPVSKPSAPVRPPN